MQRPGWSASHSPATNDRNMRKHMGSMKEHAYAVGKTADYYWIHTRQLAQQDNKEAPRKGGGHNTTQHYTHKRVKQIAHSSFGSVNREARGGSDRRPPCLATRHPEKGGEGSRTIQQFLLLKITKHAHLPATYKRQQAGLEMAWKTRHCITAT